MAGPVTKEGLDGVWWSLHTSGILCSQTQPTGLWNPEEIIWYAELKAAVSFDIRIRIRSSVLDLSQIFLSMATLACTAVWTVLKEIGQPDKNQIISSRQTYIEQQVMPFLFCWNLPIPLFHFHASPKIAPFFPSINFSVCSKPRKTNLLLCHCIQGEPFVLKQFLNGKTVGLLWKKW